MADEDIQRTIDRVQRHIDFGDYEMDVYLAVLDNGELTPSEIAEHSDVPQTRVYDIVRELEDRELVEIRESRPMRIVAIDPEDVFPSLTDSLETISESLKRRYTEPAGVTEAVSLVKSSTSILRYIEDVIESAEYELVLSLTPNLLGRLEDDLEEARSRGVVIELLLTPARDVPAAEDYDYGTVATITRARRGVTTPVLAVADGDYSVFATRDAISGAGDLYGVIFNRSELGFLITGFFNTVLWTTAEVLTDASDVWEYPRRYASIRRCIKDIQERDGVYYANIEGREVETGEYRSIAGQVVDVTIDRGGQVAAITVETADGTIDVGGRVAAFEDIEAHEIYISHDAPT
ncbi:TrmB family transcriptional regulator [Haloarculaceae archaeon H-GB2-1]|nr:TrmB family transcriptional regulator [Haloarculaceae archaeon H-GB1-1]MEA5408241.1 TrmB family transcriptional regulator [Haloarculaceae archaeon H-GB2-1]